MSDYSAVAPPPQQNFNQSSAFAAALQRAKQIAAKINPAASAGENRQKRPLEDPSDDFSEPDAKKLAGNGPSSVQGAPPGGRPGQPPGLGGVSNMSGGPPPLGGGPQINEDIKVPDKMVGLIIGRGGEQITRLQAESGCKIQMAPDSAGMPERVCSLSGTRDAISRAKELIMNIVHQRGRSEGLAGLDLGPGLGQGVNNSGPMGGGGGGGGNGGGGGGGGRNFVEIMVPGPKVGLIIGKGGETIKQLQERSGAKMVVIQDGPNQEQEKPLRISGDPSKVEYAKQLVYDLIAEKEMQAFNRGSGGGGGGGGGNRGGRGGGSQDERGGGGGGYNDYGNNDVEVLVPRAAVGVVIGKGGDMIKKIQAETGARVQFQQARDEGPGERRCYLSGKPQNVEQARQRIEELIDSVHRRDGGEGGNNGGGGGCGRNGGQRGGGRDRFDGRGGGNGRNGGSGGEYGGGGGGGWEDRRAGGGNQQECSFTVPASKCGVIIGRGGDTIKQINQQSGAHCELDRRSPAQPNGDKTFIIRGEPDQIETAKRIISDKVQIPLNFVSVGGNMSNNLPTAYPGMAPQGYNPQGWGVPGFQQQWGGPNQQSGGGDAGGNGPPTGQPVQMNAGAGQPDYSLQWAEYYRSLGMLREAEMIEQQAKNKNPGQPGPTSGPVGMPTSNPQGPAPVAQQQASAANGAQPDYSAQWAEYYRSLGKVKEAEAIEAQMKNKSNSNSGPATPMPGNPAQNNPGNQYQQPYGGYQQPGGYYGQQGGQGGGPPGVPQGGQYGFPGYGYGNSAPQQQDNN